MSLLLPLAVSFGLLAASLGIGFLALWRAKTVGQAAALKIQALQLEQDATLSALHETVVGLAAQVQEIRLQPLTAAPAASRQPALNLTKRSQALRMHRRGESDQEIAAALEIPRQELELLLKVHRIVMSNLN